MKLCSTLLAIAAALLMAACGGGGSSMVPAKSMQATAPSYSTDDLYQFFAVAFGAAPGTVYMGQLLDAANAGMSTKDIVNVFTTKDQFTSVYPLTLTNVEFATRLSANVIGLSATDQAKQNAVNDIVSALAAGWTRGDVIFAVFNNLANKSPTDQEWGGTSTKMKNQVVYAKYYTEVMKGDSTAVATLQSVISSVTETSNTLNGIDHAILAAINPLFSSTPLLLPDLRGKYDSLCGNPIAARVLPFADFNKDGKNDIIIYLACINVSGSTPTNPKPVVNGVVVFLQQSNGTFRDGTRDLFGVDMLISDAIAVDGVVSDFNSDGYSDIVFSMNKEDGRPQPAGSTANNVQNAFITSNNDGSYTISRLGQYTWGAGVVLVDNEFGGSDVAFSPIGYGATNEAWRYSDGWHLLEGYEWVNYGTSFFKRDLATNSSHTAVTRSPYPSVGVDLYTKNNGSPWTFRSSWTAASTVIPWINWFGEKLSTTMITLNGKDYVSAGFDKSCELKQYPNKKSIAIAIFQGYEVVGGYHGQELHESGDTGSLIEFSKVIGFTVIDGAISELNLNIRKGLNGRGFGVQCGDFDDDGYDDIMLTPWGPTAVPMIYLNDHVGGFDLVDSKKFPLPSLLYRDSIFKYEDIDGDGIRDLMFYPANGMSEEFGKTPPVQYQVYKGLRKITKFDIQ